MAKIKMFSGLKKCSTGEIYKFRDGVAVVPGMYFNHKEIHITIKEFLELNKEENAPNKSS